MSLKIKHEDENDNIVSLGNDQIKSILKVQSEAVFQEKNISNNSNFVKKSLIDIALDFESKQEKDYNRPDEFKSPISTEIDTNELQMEQTEAIDVTQSSIESSDTKDPFSDNKDDNDIDLAKDNNSEDIINEQVNNDNIDNKEPIIDKLEDDNNKQIDVNSDAKNDEVSSTNDLQNDKVETQQALESVRDAVSQSIKKSDNEVIDMTEDINSTSDKAMENILKDMDDFKSIFSSLSSMSEKAIYDVIENKILDLANELAGYQIDKMPEKFEKKIRTFLKNINCFEEKITIEVNEKDLEALSKIKDFKNISQKSQFLANKDISRGDIILNCDGMSYSEKTLKKN